jgi:hypothetical protein
MREHMETNAGHGRVEERRMRAVSVREGIYGWDGVRQWCQIRRTRWVKGKKSVDYAYAITSLDSAQAPPEFLLRLNRAHWGVEAMHWVKDTLLREDASTLRTGNTPQAIAVLRNIKLTLIKNLGMTPKQGHEFLFNNINYIRKTTGW